MKRLLVELNKGVLITSILAFLFFGTGLNSESNTCLYVCVGLLVPIAISTIIYNVTANQEERR